MVRRLWWYLILPVAGTLLVYAVDAARDDHSGYGLWEFALLVCIGVGALVAWLAVRSGFAIRAALVRGLVAGAETLALVWVPLIAFIALCDGCIS